MLDKKDPNRVLAILTEVVSSFFGRLESRQLVSRILNAAIELTQADRGSVFLVPDGSTEPHTHLVSLIATGMQGKEIRVGVNQGVVGHVYTGGIPVIINDVKTDERFYSQVDAHTQYQTKSIACVPLRTPAGAKLGVLQVLNKPGRFAEDDLQVLQVLALFAAIAIEQNREISKLVEVNENLKKERVDWLGQTENYLMESCHPGLNELFQKIPAFARSDSSILIEGESGTGKEVIARLLHVKSARKDHPFVAINCAAIPESLFEAELFGVTKGAATGTAARKGKFLAADRGTLFLDEIGELPLSVQAKLLRVLQDKRVSPLGSDEQSIAVNFRVIAATNRDLEARVRAGQFREDLFYRLNVVRFGLPGLKDRSGDIPELARGFMQAFHDERGWQLKEIPASVMQVLSQYSWPGNIRQLQNKLEGAMINSGERTTLEIRDFGLADVPQEGARVARLSSGVQFAVSELNIKNAKDSLEAVLIREALKKTGGNKTEAAKLLGISREGLRKAAMKLLKAA